MKTTVSLLLFAFVLVACSFIYIGDGKTRQDSIGANNPACVIGCEASGTAQNSAALPASAASR